LENYLKWKYFVAGGYGCTLYLNATPSGVVSLYKTMPLWVQTDASGTRGATMPLFLQTTEPTGTINKPLTLFVQNDYQEKSKTLKLFVRGAGGLDGGLTSSAGMPLYIERWPAAACTLFIGADTASSSVPLYIMGANFFNTNTTLYTSGGAQLVSSGVVPLFVSAGGAANSGISLYTAGLPSVTNTTDLYTHGF
jgi:hypothetical protein